MKRFYEKQDGMGYQEVITKEAGLEVIGFDLIRLNPGESLTHESGEFEL